MSTKLPKITEAQFTRQVIQLAQACGWKVAHFRPALTAKGWRTAVQGDGKGFPDLVLAHKQRRVVGFVELKVGGKVTAEQEEWLETLDAGVCRVKDGFCMVWTPDDWPRIETILKG